MGQPPSFPFVAWPHNELHFSCGGVRHSRAIQQMNTPARLCRADAPGSYKCVLWGSREHSGPEHDTQPKPAASGNLPRKRSGRQPRGAAISAIDSRLRPAGQPFREAGWRDLCRARKLKGRS